MPREGRPSTASQPPPRHGRFTMTVYGATFDHAVAPSRLLTGTLREKGTGKPIPGMMVTGSSSLARVLTDAQGRYQLPGCPKAARYTLFTHPNQDQPYFRSSVTLRDQPGLDPLAVDCEMSTGIPFRATFLDQTT